MCPDSSGRLRRSDAPKKEVCVAIPHLLHVRIMHLASVRRRVSCGQMLLNNRNQCEQTKHRKKSMRLAVHLICPIRMNYMLLRLVTKPDLKTPVCILSRSEVRICLSTAQLPRSIPDPAAAAAAPFPLNSVPSAAVALFSGAIRTLTW